MSEYTQIEEKCAELMEVCEEVSNVLIDMVYGSTYPEQSTMIELINKLDEATGRVEGDNNENS